MGWITLVQLGVAVTSWFRDRYNATVPDPVHGFQSKIQLPTSNPGAVVPLIYGKTRVKAPVLAWWGTAQANLGSIVGSGAPFEYGIDMFFVIGIPFELGSAGVKGMWAGELKLTKGGDWNTQTGNGNHEAPLTINSGVMPGGTGWIGGLIETLNGKPTQVLVDGSLVSKTKAADRMIASGVTAQRIPGYRGALSAFLFNESSVAWYIGPNPQPDSYSFEAASYPIRIWGPDTMIGLDANPIDVLSDFLTGTRGKVGLDLAKLDSVSFTAAAATLAAEGHGFSRSWEQKVPASEMIIEILKQIDAALYEDPRDGLIKIKLIRPDYYVNDIASITPANCEALLNYSAGGWTEVINKISVTFTNRDNDYRDGTGIAFNQANSVGQDGEVRELVLSMPGITTQALANQVAGRELAWRSRPNASCQAVVTREFLRTMPGDPVLLTWPEANISPTVFRVTAVNQGDLQKQEIKLDLIQDSFYVWRRLPPQSEGIAPFPGPSSVA